jgi:uncharacterized membrane protein
VLSCLRFILSGTGTFLFLNWNLFLAFIPWAAATAIAMGSYGRNKIMLAALLVIWLLFFPNAPYILTDLFHLQQRASAPMWFDLVLILSFAWTGLAYGIISLFEIEELLNMYMRKSFTRIVVTVMLFAGSFGVYLGRYLRWNSWDLFSEPTDLLTDIASRFVFPFSHLQTWGVTILLGILLNMIYWSFKLFDTDRKSLTVQ